MPSEKVPVALKCVVRPWAAVAEVGVMAMLVSVAGDVDETDLLPLSLLPPPQPEISARTSKYTN